MALWYRLIRAGRWVRSYHDLWRERFISVVLRIMLWAQGSKE